MLSTKELTDVIDELDLKGLGGGMVPVTIDSVFQVPEEEEEELSLAEPVELNPLPFKALPPKRRVVALDGTSMTLGRAEDATVGAVRGSVVVREPVGSKFSIQHYGPYLVCFTNQNRGEVYSLFRSHVFGLKNPSKAPSLGKMVDRTRNFLEKLLQLKLAQDYSGCLLLFDGSMTVGPIDSPRSFLERVMRIAAQNDNDIVSVSKHTTLTLKGSEKSILSPLEEVPGPCCCDVKPYLSASSGHYKPIRVFTVKLSRDGEAFRVDIPMNSPSEPARLLSETAGLAGAFGYPEELKIAHIASIFSSLEVLELQAAAAEKYRLELREEIRKKIFGPWG